RGGKPVGPGAQRQGLHAGVLGTPVQGLGTGMALHESTAQAGSVHTWVWPAKPEGAQSGGCNLASGDPFSPTYPPGRTAFGAAAGTAHSRPTSGAGQSQSGTTSPMRMHVQTRA